MYILCTTASLWKNKFWNRFKCIYMTTWQEKMEKHRGCKTDEMMSQWFALFSLFFFLSLSEPWCHPRFKSPLAGVSASLTWNQRKSKVRVREQETRVRGKRWRARKGGPGERKEAWEQIFRGKKTDGNRKIKEVRQTKMRKFKERFSVSHQLFLCAQMTDITWQVLITDKLKKVQKHTQRSHRLCLI